MKTRRAFGTLAIIAIIASCTQAGTEESRTSTLAQAPGVESPQVAPVEAAPVESRASAPMKSCTCGKDASKCTCEKGKCGCGKSGSECKCAKAEGSCGCKHHVPEA